MIFRHASSMWRTIDHVAYSGWTGPNSSKVASISGVTVIVTIASVPGRNPSFTLYSLSLSGLSSLPALAAGAESQPRSAPAAR